MCLPDFVEFKKIKKSEALIGYRNWWLNIKDSIKLKSDSRDYFWDKTIEGPHKVEKENSGIYSYNNYYNNFYNYSNYYNYNNNYNNYNNYYYNYKNYYNISGIIHQYGKVAIHRKGYRSQYAIINTLFTISESDAKGPKEFLDWIKVFNSNIETLAKKYKCKTEHYQDFLERMKQ